MSTTQQTTMPAHSASAEQLIITPAQLHQDLALTASLQHQVQRHRQTIQSLVAGTAPGLLVVVGPCSLHDSQATLDFGQRLAALQQEVGDSLVLVMRAYIEKPRTILGWKGLVNDPDRDGSNNLNKGLHLARQLMLQLLELGLPLATEALNPALSPYFADLISWYALGARTTESQTHREMASNLPASLGFKNGTDGSLDIAINAIKAARQPQHITSINTQGQLVSLQAPGNCYGHLVLRGGASGPNYQPEQVAAACQALQQAGLNPRLMVDASHANCAKIAERQQQVLVSVGHQILNQQPIMGVMLESFIHAGQQPLQAGAGVYGQSMTDPCLDWAATRTSLLQLATQVEQQQLAKSA